MEDGLRQPALPKEAPSPMPPRSISTTSLPSRRRKLAAATPMAPPPMTATVRFLSDLLEVTIVQAALRKSAQRSPIMMQFALRLPLTMTGMIEASAT